MDIYWIGEELPKKVDLCSQKLKFWTGHFIFLLIFTAED